MNHSIHITVCYNLQQITSKVYKIYNNITYYSGKLTYNIGGYSKFCRKMEGGKCEGNDKKTLSTNFGWRVLKA